ncbi:energy transducer TonB [Sphingobacterium sp. SRCM116780]|uniref:energy transducer TonB n=1 Tax=Sphingobacterium sp. SRCM116780 TaxID=2907623 RepID=UPI001F25135F|nr:energy transducer TonB [Sphingobacterium sp. SRCM116780]UIR56461.1 energy transducer TonB [Sphingobacterium sp. SRCM116780]
MWNSKLNIYKNEWLEVVFAGRNQTYGAYELRKISNKATNWAIITVTALIGITLISKGVYDRYFKEADAPFVQETVTNIDLGKLEEIEKKFEEKKIEEPIPVQEKAPQQIAQDPPKQDLIRFVEPTVAPRSLVTEDVVTQDELNKSTKMSARLSLKANPNGTYVARGEFGAVKRDGGITGAKVGSINGNPDAIVDFNSVEIMPTPQGGIQAFMKWVGENYQYPEAALQQGVNGVVEVSFVVEKDGSLTDIVVKRDVSYGTGKAAVELLNKAKKWKPGIQNGRTVRVAYTLPIRLNTISQ